MKHGTLLDTISRRDLNLECRKCGHRAVLPLHEVIAQSDPGTPLGTFLASIRCRHCGEANPDASGTPEAPGGGEQNIAEENHRQRVQLVRG